MICECVEIITSVCDAMGSSHKHGYLWILKTLTIYIESNESLATEL